MKKMKNSKGFTLMEMLIVVAIIAVLVAIAIPTFTSQLEKAREATDLANLRGAYAEVMAAALSNSTELQTAGTTAGSEVWSKTVTPTQKQTDWQTTITDITIGGVAVPAAITSGTWTVQYSAATGKVTIAPTT